MKNTKKNVQKIAFLLIAILLSATVSNAEQHRNEGPRKIPNEQQIEKMVSHLEKDLSLNAEQKAKITDLFVAHFEKVKAELKQEKPQMEKMRETHEMMKNEFESSLEALLTLEQAKQFEVFKEKRRHEEQIKEEKCDPLQK